MKSMKTLILAMLFVALRVPSVSLQGREASLSGREQEMGPL